MFLDKPSLCIWIQLCAFTFSAQRFALPALGRGRRSRPARKMIRRRKLPEIAADSPASGARFVGRCWVEDAFIFSPTTHIYILSRFDNQVFLQDAQTVYFVLRNPTMLNTLAFRMFQ